MNPALAILKDRFQPKPKPTENLMLTGIALVGTVTAAVASWFVNIVRTSATENAPLAAAEGLLSEQITALTQTVELMRAELADLRGRVVDS